MEEPELVLMKISSTCIDTDYHHFAEAMARVGGAVLVLSSAL